MKKNKKPYLYIILSGVLMGISFNIPSISFIAWFALIPFIYILFTEEYSYKKSFLYSFTYGLTFYLMFMTCLKSLFPLDWMGFSDEVSILVIIAGILGFSFMLSVPLGFLGVIYKKLKLPNSKLLNAILLSSIWVVIEFIQGLGIMGFTGGQLAASQFMYLPLIQSASLFGALFISFLIVLVNSLLSISLIETRKEGKKYYIILSILIFVANLAFGCVSMIFKNYDSADIKVAIIQGNIASGQKWEDNMSQKIYDTYMDLSYDALKENPDIIVWPETAVPVDISDNELLYDQYVKLAEDMDGLFLVGVIAKTEVEGIEKDFNAVLSIEKTGFIEPAYFKRHLVPFGEFIPYRDTLTKLFPAIVNMAGLGDLTPGTDSNVVSTSYGKVGSLICYESIFSTLARDSIKDGAELFVVATNDSWFKDSTATTKHFAHSVLRAVEYDRFLVRAGNTGISSVISPEGKLLTTLPAMEQGYITENVEFINSRTLYSYIGDLFVLICFLFILSMIFYKHSMRNK